MSKGVRPDVEAEDEAALKPGPSAREVHAKRRPWWEVRVIDPGDIEVQPRVRVGEKEYQLCRRSLCIFSVHSAFRQRVLAFVCWKWFDRLILGLILLNSILLACYQYRQPDDVNFNYVYNNVIDYILTGCFAVELILKVIAWGFFIDERSYLRDAWNWLDFIVVISALSSYALGDAVGLGFLRVFRVLRPLRSLNKVPQMKVLVNTVLSSIPRLGNVTVMGAFLFIVFAIIGITLMDGIFYRRCRYTREPTLTPAGGTMCWAWPAAAEDSERLCGGHYMCGASQGVCTGHENDPIEDYRPKFPSSGKQGYGWCAGDEPKKLFPETDFIHFDHVGGALLVVFQSMTLEGWTDIMYLVQDSYSLWIGTVYFFLLVFITSFFLLNVALAVVDEARDDFAEEEPEDKNDPDYVSEGSMDDDMLGSALDEPLWLDHPIVRTCHSIATSEPFMNVIMFFIVANVVTMMLDDQYPPLVELLDFLEVCEYTFLAVFSLEMIIMLIALGVKRYVLNPITCFDGVIVIISLISAAMGKGGPFTALRTLRLFRVLNKLANRWSSFRVLMKAIVQTGISLNYWLVLFLLVLYICTLMAQEFFARYFHFNDPESFDIAIDPQATICSDGTLDCIPRAHFDTFGWAFVTIFQVMTGENWNTIMYAGMRARGWPYVLFFVFLVLFGQTLVLSLFLSMLMSKFDTVQDDMERQEMVKMESRKKMKEKQSTKPLQLPKHTSIMSRFYPGAHATDSTSSKPFVEKDDQEASCGAESPESNRGSRQERDRSIRVQADVVPVLLPGELEESPTISIVNEGPPSSSCELVESCADVGEEMQTPRPASKDTGGERDKDKDKDKVVSVPHTVPTLKDNWRSQWPHGFALFIFHEDSTIRQACRKILVYEVQYGNVGTEHKVRAPRWSKKRNSRNEVQDLKDGRPTKKGPEPKKSRSELIKSLFTTLDAEADESLDEQSMLRFAQQTGFEGGREAWDKAYKELFEDQGRDYNDGIDLEFFTLLVNDQNDGLYCTDFELQIILSRLAPKRSIKAFDSLILVCILLSTLCMAVDYPLRDPDDGLTQLVRNADYVFAIIFIIEMVVKLLAYGLIWGPEAYLKSGWNWLDGIVVIVSVVGMVSDSNSAPLKTLRILRAFRPLRVISRNQNLKVVVQTIFSSIPDLFTLVIVSILLLLIFALFALSYFSGRMSHCTDAGSVMLQSNPQEDLVTPLCLRPGPWNLSEVDHSYAACASPLYDSELGTWVNPSNPCPGTANCAAELSLAWKRASADTPICVGRCDSFESAGQQPPESLCPRKLTSTDQVPSSCPDKDTAEYRARVTSQFGTAFLEAELYGETYAEKMKRAIIMPCGGSTVNDASGNVETPTSVVSCRDTFCPDGASDEKVDQCKSYCNKHPQFCVEACGESDKDASSSPQCASCLQECEASCQCADFCEPLIKDAALCHEQGSRWSEILSQSFDNIFKSMLTLFEISTTEGWVDVMYASADARSFYEQPVRDNQEFFACIFFVIYIFGSFMFIINLSVGVIVDKFMDLKKDGQVLMTEAQEEWKKNWIESRRRLDRRKVIYSLENLHTLTKNRRRAYEVISSKCFDTSIMAAIAFNTVLMCMAVFPEPTTYWDDILESVNYGFAAVFTFEAALKLFALHGNYWKDGWNVFDFCCVIATYLGILVNVSSSGANFAAVAQVIRIFRIARLFRILKFLKGLHKVMMALVLSLPKLANVFMILMLMLTLYSILGVNLFSTVKPGETFDHHGNFRHFLWAFVTLFRASTGEAWNEIMHDLSRDQRQLLREGDWCTPAHLFDTKEFDKLQSKCLIESPNSCPEDLGPSLLAPAIYWVTFTLIITFVIMNLVIAVILEGYEDGKSSPESVVIELCIKVWQKYDPDHRMQLPLTDALSFMQEVLLLLKVRVQIVAPEVAADNQQKKLRARQFGVDVSALASIPMKYARQLDLQLSEDGQVGFHRATVNVVRFSCLDNNPDRLREIDAAKVEVCTGAGALPPDNRNEKGEQQSGLREHIAAAKLQWKFRQLQEKRASMNSEGVRGSRTTGSWAKNKDEEDEAGLRHSAIADKVEEPVMTPPKAG